MSNLLGCHQQSYKRGLVVLFTAFFLFSTFGTVSADSDTPSIPTTLTKRLVPFIGEESLSQAPIDHGNLLNQETSEFVDPKTRTPIHSYEHFFAVKDGEGVPRIMRNNLGVNSNPTERQSVFYFAHLTDLQIVDEESPALTPTNDFSLDGDSFQGSFRQQNPYIPHIADALIEATNTIAQQTRDFDLVFHTGDALENAQKNELDLFLGLLNGGIIDPDSGLDDNVFTEQFNDPSDPFIAYGLKNCNGSQTPWLSLIGNHDILVQGNFPESVMDFNNSVEIVDGLVSSFSAMGFAVPNLPTAAERRDQFTPEMQYLIPTMLDRNIEANDNFIPGISRPLILSDLISRNDLLKVFQNTYSGERPNFLAIAADANREMLDRCEFIDGHLNANGLPKGHGFSAKLNRPVNNQCVGHYSYIPAQNRHLRFIVLDTAKQMGGADGAVARPELPYDAERLIKVDENGQRHLVVDPTTSVNFSRGKTLLLQPGSQNPLFLLPAPQYQADAADKGDSERDSIAFLEAQLDAAKKQEQLAVVVSHNSSDTLNTVNDLRLRIEVLFCLQLKAINPNLDCDATDGTLATGHVGADVRNAAAAGNVQAKNLYAQLIGAMIGQNVASFDLLTQDHLNILAVNNQEAFTKLLSTFTLLFSYRNIMPDPIDALSTVEFRKMLANNDNVILHMVGHSHFHKITAICDNGEAVNDLTGTCAESSASPEAGYYEIRTASGVDWPLEQGLLEIVDNNDGTVSILRTIFGLADQLEDAPLVKQGVSLTLADSLTKPDDVSDKPHDLNVELLVKIPASVDKALDQVPTRKQIALN